MELTSQNKPQESSSLRNRIASLCKSLQKIREERKMNRLLDYGASGKDTSSQFDTDEFEIFQLGFLSLVEFCLESGHEPKERSPKEVIQADVAPPQTVFDSSALIERVLVIESDLSAMKSSFREIKSKISKSRSPPSYLDSKKPIEVVTLPPFEDKHERIFRDPFDFEYTKRNIGIQNSDTKETKAKVSKVRSMAFIGDTKRVATDKKVRKSRPRSVSGEIFLALKPSTTLTSVPTKSRRNSLGSTLDKISYTDESDSSYTCPKLPRSLAEAQKIKFDRIFDGTTSFKLFRILFETTFSRCPDSVLTALLLSHVTDNVRAFMVPFLEKNVSWESLCSKLEMKYNGQRSLQLLWFKFMELQLGPGESIQSFIDRFDLIAQTLLSSKTIGIPDVQTVVLRAIEPHRALANHCRPLFDKANSLKEIIAILLEAKSQAETNLGL